MIIQLYAEKEVVEDVEDTLEQISLEDARKMDGKYDIGDIVTCTDRIQIIWKNCNTECQEPDSCRKFSEEETESCI